MMPPLRVEQIRDVEALSAVAPEWRTLWENIQVATPFQSPDWLLPWWRVFTPGELMVVTIRRSGRLVGIAPFYVDATEGSQRLLPVGIALSDYLDVLVEPAIAEMAGAALVECLVPVSWHEWELAEGPPQAATAMHARAPADCVEVDEASSCCPVLALPTRVEDLTFSPLQQRKLRQAHRRARRGGGAEISCVGPADADRFLGDLSRFHGARWQNRGRSSLVDDERVRRFHAAALPLLIAQRLARLYELRIDGQVAALYYGFLHRRRAYAYLGGFDQDLATLSPGMLLMEHAIRQALLEGAREFDFLRGREAYKYRWGAVDRWNRRRLFRRMDHHALA